MSKYRKPFLKLFCDQWAARFPAWRRGAYAPVYWARPDCTFSDDSAFATSGLIFHTVLNFSPKKRGVFTADIIVMSSPDPYPDDRLPPTRWAEHITELLEGQYRIGWFFAGADHWWHLFDEAAESKRFWESIPNLPQPITPLPREKGHWYASSYDLPLADIITEATNHFCDVFEGNVLPQLHGGTKPG